ncbi:hypothetical protein Fuma_01834 [Fuerstiella marisgermanici]|uniref:Uncharacterized protein n=2 Tax=Fuerstiella marisgermanici TaxID=1891926 RepID=A0A1P8WDV4_9PLAN|nr:hypothetical protein Fuma_01834 [Fuerstiella marisgermanici]
MITMTDLFATAADIVRQELPSDAAEDSFSLLPVLLGREEKIVGRKAIFILGNGKDSAVAVGSEQWKLIVRYGDDEDRGNELYDLSKDPGEQTNVINDHPVIAEQLSAAYRKAESDGRTRPR